MKFWPIYRSKGGVDMQKVKIKYEKPHPFEAGEVVTYWKNANLLVLSRDKRLAYCQLLPDKKYVTVPLDEVMKVEDWEREHGS